MGDEKIVTLEKSTRPIGVYASVIIALISELCLILAVYRFELFGALDRLAAVNFCVSYVFSENVCLTLSGLPSTILLMSFALAIMAFMLPGRAHPLKLSENRVVRAPPSVLMMISNLTGLALIIAPYLLVVIFDTRDRHLFQGLWSVGAFLFVSPCAIYVAFNSDIVNNLKLRHLAVLLFVGVAPELSTEVNKRLWLETSLQNGTMFLVQELLTLLGQPYIYTPPETLGIRTFSVYIGSPCAGLSGILFSAALVSLFLMLSWQVIDIRRAMILIPAAATLSWLANSVRIAILIIIGEYISPQLAVDGFHSYAGWISIVLISSLTMYVAVRIRWFHREGVHIEPRTVLLGTTDAVYLLPFAVFMLTLLLVSAISNNPDALYPFRISVVAFSLILFWRAIPSDLEFPDWNKIYAMPALALAVLWIWAGASESKPLSEVLPNATDLEMLVWMAFRVAGTVLVVPVVEELFFRGYLLRKASTLLYNNNLAAVLLTSVLFALLHSNIILAFAAGVLFGYVRIRTGGLVNAMACHALCNACIAAWALSVDNWAVI